MARRIFGVVAIDAPVAAIILRGPTDWCQVGRWDLARGAYDAGAWLHGVVYPQRCDLSPDGRWFSYFAHQPSATWELGWTFEAISRLPWLTALAAWATDGTWTRGLAFDADPSVRQVGAPDHGSTGPLDGRLGLRIRRAISFAVERERGWSEAPGSPPRDEQGDFWDERRAATLRMRKPRPGVGGTALEVRGRYAAFRSGHVEGAADIGYALASGDERHVLEGVQWADRTADGRLLVATEDDRLRILDGAGAEPLMEVELGPPVPEPVEPPAQARSW